MSTSETNKPPEWFRGSPHEHVSSGYICREEDLHQPPVVGRITLSHHNGGTLWMDAKTGTWFETKESFGPFRCPVCNGSGCVPQGFYDGMNGTIGTGHTAPDTCRSCQGTGIVWAQR